MFLDNVEKLIREATVKYGQLDSQRRRLQEEKSILEQNINRTIEEELRVVGELRALEVVKKDALENEPTKVMVKES